MDTSLSTLLIAVITVLSLIVIFLLSREWQRRERQIGELTKRIRALEQAQLQRLPHRSFEELLDAMAALDKELTERNFYNSLIENAKGHIANAMKVGTKRENK